MTNDSEKLTSTYRTLSKIPLNEIVDLAEGTTELSEREFYMTLFGFELQKRQREILPKKGGEFFDFSND